MNLKPKKRLETFIPFVALLIPIVCNVLVFQTNNARFIFFLLVPLLLDGVALFGRLLHIEHI